MHYQLDEPADPFPLFGASGRGSLVFRGFEQSRDDSRQLVAHLLVASPVCSRARLILSLYWGEAAQ